MHNLCHLHAAACRAGTNSRHDHLRQSLWRPVDGRPDRYRHRSHRLRHPQSQSSPIRSSSCRFHICCSGSHRIERRCKSASHRQRRGHRSVSHFDQLLRLQRRSEICLRAGCRVLAKASRPGEQPSHLDRCRWRTDRQSQRHGRSSANRCRQSHFAHLRCNPRRPALRFAVRHHHQSGRSAAHVYRTYSQPAVRLHALLHHADCRALYRNHRRAVRPDAGRACQRHARHH